MKVYFYTQISGQESKDIINYLKKTGIFLTTNFSSEIKQKDTSADQPLDKIDILIVHGQNLDAKSGYLIASALSQGKEVLCLLPSGTKLDSSLDSLQNDKTFKKKLLVKFYETGQWQKILADFLSQFEKKDVKEFFNIKFTLRLSSKILDYLNWKAKQEGMPKADWLRLRIKDMMEADKKYQDFWSNKFKK